MDQLNKKTNVSKFGFFAILMTAFVWNYEISAVGPALGIFAQAFPGTSDMVLQIMLLIPMMVAIFFSILAGRLAKRFDKKNIVIIGLIFYGVAGTLPAFASSMGQIIALRAITGIGVGFVLPMTIAILADHSEGVKRIRLISLTSTVANIANTAVAILVGFIMTYTWRATFYPIAFVFVVLIIVILGVPKSPPQKNSSTEKVKLPGFAYKYTALMVLAWVFGFSTIMTSLFVINEKIFAPQLIGLAIAAVGIGCALGGVIYPTLLKISKKGVLSINLIIYAVGYIVLFLSHSFILVVIGNLLTGIGLIATASHINCATAQRATVQAEKDASLGLVGAAIGISAIFQPFITAGIVALNPGFTSQYRWIYLFCVISLFVWAILAFILRNDKVNSQNCTDNQVHS